MPVRSEKGVWLSDPFCCSLSGISPYDNYRYCLLKEIKTMVVSQLRFYLSFNIHLKLDVTHAVFYMAVVFSLPLQCTKILAPLH